MGFEAGGNSSLPTAVNQTASSTVVGGNLTGKEIRFGAAPSALFGASATGTSTGSVDSMHDSFTPLGGGVVLTNMMFGEVSPGGTGSGLYGMLILAMLSVFIAGLDGRAHARVPGQEDPGGRDEAGGDLHPDRAGRGPRIRRRLDRYRARQGGAAQSRPARPERDGLRVRLAGQQQRLGLRGLLRQHDLVQRELGDRHAARPLRADGPGARDRRLAWPQAGRARILGHAADRHRAVRHDAGRA